MKKIKSRLSETSLKNNKKFNRIAEEFNVSTYLPIKFKDGIHSNYLFLILNKKAILEIIPLSSNCKIHHMKENKLTSFSINHEVIKNYIDEHTSSKYNPFQ